MEQDKQDALRAPFPPEVIGKLPRSTKADNPKGKCNECGGWHGLPAVHLDYVGHAAVTDRLLAVDPDWTWEPVAFGPDGAPFIRHSGKEAELWIRLTVCGVTRYGVGTAPSGAFELSKQLISDALRNAAMRFGVALDLWSKEDLHAEAEAPPEPRIPEARAKEIAKVLNDAGAEVRKEWMARFQVKPADLPLSLLSVANDWLSDLEAE